MTAMSAQPLPAGPVDSLEVRWIVPGPLGWAAREWFTEFSAGTEAHEDIYLLQPQLAGLSVKLRDGSTLDVKSYRGGGGVLALPGRGRGRLESWRKWSFPYDALPAADPATAGWVTVRKRRYNVWFSLPASRDPAPALAATGTGCMAELAGIQVRGKQWWSVALEATGSALLLAAAVQHAADLLFARPPPAGAQFSLDNSFSYTQWLHLRFGPEAGDPQAG